MLFRFFVLVQILFVFCVVALADDKSFEKKQFGQWVISKCSTDTMTDSEQCIIDSVPLLLVVGLNFSLWPFSPAIGMVESQAVLAEIRVDKNGTFSTRCTNQIQNFNTCFFEIRTGREIFNQMSTGSKIMARITKYDGKQSIITLDLSEFRMALDYIKSHFKPAFEGFSPLPPPLSPSTSTSLIPQPEVSQPDRKAQLNIVQLQARHNASRLYLQPNPGADRLSTVSAGVNLKVIENRGTWLYIETPDQRKGWILSEWTQK